MLSNKLPYLLLIILGLITFGNTLQHGFVLDDNAIITKHQHVQKGLEGISEIVSTNYLNGLQNFNDGLYRPLSPVSFAIEQQIQPEKAFIGHLFNVIYVLLTSIVMFLVLKNTFRLKDFIALGISMIFLVLPVHSEVVANIKSRDEIFALLFTLSALLFYGNYLKTFNKKELVIGALLFFLGLFSKESTFSFVLILPACLYLIYPTNRKQLIEIAVVNVALGGLFLFIRHQVLSSMPTEVGEGTLSALNNSILAAETYSEKFGTAFWLQTLYLIKTLVPYSLQHDYSFNAIEIVPITSLKAISGLVVLIAGAYFTFTNFKKRPLIAVGLIWYFGSLMIVSNIFFSIGATFAERFLYAPSFGILIIVAGLLEYYHDSVKNIVPKTYWIITSILIGIYAVFTIDRNADWESNYTLFSADYEKLENSARGNYNYGSACQAKAQITKSANEKKALHEASVVALQKAIEIYPTYWDAYNNLSMSYKELGQLDQAIATLNQLVKEQPTYQKGWYNLGADYYAVKDFQSALNAFNQYININNSNPQIWYFAGMSAGYLNDFSLATKYLENCIKLDPNFIDALLMLGKAYGLLKDLDKSEYYFKRTLQINPNHPEAKQGLQMTLQIKAQQTS